MFRSKEDPRVSARPPVPPGSERITSSHGVRSRTPESRGTRSVNSTVGRISGVESSEAVVCTIHATTGSHGSGPCRQGDANPGRLADRTSHEDDRRSPKNRAFGDSRRKRIQRGVELKMARRDKGWMCVQTISCKAAVAWFANKADIVSTDGRRPRRLPTRSDAWGEAMRLASRLSAGRGSLPHPLRSSGAETDRRFNGRNRVPISTDDPSASL
jgi:hypothetical protein